MIQIGIDLGTTNTVVCRARNGIYEYFQLDNNNNNMMPSVMRCSKNGVVVGINAKNAILDAPEECIYNSKVYMGTEKTWCIHEKVFTARDVAEEILKKVHNRLKEQFPGEELVASISVPACFTQKQIELTYDAASKSGFQIKNIVPEPVAAAKAARMNGENAGKLFVVDIGGGTFDITAVQNEKNEYGSVVTKCLAVGGNRNLGGNNFDECIYDNLILPVVYKTFGKDFLQKFTEKVLKRGQQELRAVAEKIKLHFQDAESTYCETLFDIFDDENEVDISVSYDEYLEAISSCSTAAELAIEEVLKYIQDNYNILPDMFDNVLIVGGMARERVIRTILTKFFEDNEIHIASRPMSFVAEGVARYAAERDVRIPCMLSVDIGLIAGTDRSKLGVVLFNKNTPIEQLEKQTLTISNSEENQTKIGVAVFEQDNNSCNKLGELIIDIPPKPVGEHKIDVTLSLSQDRILQIKAVDYISDKEYETEFYVGQ